MKCRLFRRRRAHLRASTPGAGIAAQLRAQIPCSTDPEPIGEIGVRGRRTPAHSKRPIFPFALADCRYGPKRD